MMRESPRIRRLRSDYRAMQALRTESSILDFEAHFANVEAPEAYVVHFRGIGAWRPAGTQEVLLRDRHEVAIRLGANYPRMMPELSWKTPIFHPNISSSGFVCLGGYGTFWAPSLNLDEMCVMLWNMVRYANYDVNSPYNRDAALWAKAQQTMVLPLDARPLRDRRAAAAIDADRELSAAAKGNPAPPPQPDIMFLNDVVEAEIVPQPEPEVLIIE
jgi:hypothetical protein